MMLNAPNPFANGELKLAGNIWGKGLSELAFAPAASEIGKDDRVV